MLRLGRPVLLQRTADAHGDLLDQPQEFLRTVQNRLGLFLLAGRSMLALDSRFEAGFLAPRSIPVAARGDDAILLYSRRLRSDPGFRAAAEAEARRTDGVFATY